MISLILTLCLASFSQAASVILISGENSALDQVSHTILSSLEKSGAALKGEENLRSLDVSSLRCKRDAAGAVDCTFVPDGQKEPKAVSAAKDLFQALLALDSAEGGFNLGSCEKDGSCEFTLSSVSCMVNERFADETPGKFGCGLVSI